MPKVPKSETWLTICLRSDVTCQDSCLVCFTAHCLMQLGWNVVCFTAEVLCLGTCALLNKMETRKQACWNSQTFRWLNRFLQTMKVLSAVALLLCFCTQIRCENGCSSDTESSEFTELYLYTWLSASWPWHGPGLYLRAMMTVNRSRSG